MNRAGEKDTLITYERALEAQADLRKFRGSTIERKHMSTKTTFKRVALVAVAALGLGVLSIAPSQADPISVTLTPTATTSAITTSETATISIAASAVLGASNDSLTVRASVTSANAATAGTIEFRGTTDSTTTRFAGAGTSAFTLDSTTVSNGTVVRGTINLNMIKPTAAGTYTVLVYTTSKTEGSLATVADKSFTWTVTVTAPSVNADSSSTALLASGYWTALTDPVADASVAAAKSATAVVNGTVKIVQKNATSSANEGLIATIAGPGFVRLALAGDTTTVASARVSTISAPGVSTPVYLLVTSDGTSGTGVVTVTGAKSGATIATKSITFSDTKPASVTAVVKKAYIAAGLSTAKVFAVTVKDAAGNAITSGAATVTGTRSDTTTAGKAIATADLSCSYDTTDKVYNCTAVGTSASGFGPAAYTITATGTDTDATKVTTTASTIYSDIVATKVIISAPAAAAVGDKITYTITATEKNGYPVADGGYEGGSANGSIGGIFWNTTTKPDYSSSSVTPFNVGETITTVSGVATKDVYMPVAAGTVTAKWTLAGSATSPVGAIDKSIAGTVITVDTVITNPGVDAAADAANEATDAANAATDAALAAADAADAATAAAEDASEAVAKLAKSVNTALANLKKQITSLTALVNKLLKK
jgi:hypothetical protein